MFNPGNTNQLPLLTFKNQGFDLTNHELTILSQNIDWDKAVSIIKSSYSLNNGRPSKSIRLMLGLELAKTYYRYSDEMVVRELPVNVALMAFCGIHHTLARDETPDASSMTKFRARFTDQQLEQLQSLVFEAQYVKLPPRKRSQLASDTTCIPANIAFPTDTNLLMKAREKVKTIVKYVNKQGASIVERGKRKLERQVRHFQRLRRKSRKQAQKINGKLIQRIESLEQQLTESITHMAIALPSHLQRELDLVTKTLGQQRELWVNKTTRVKDRIVSLHEPDVRPIFRGKARAATEFGKKIGLMTIGQKLVLITRDTYQNFSDHDMVTHDQQYFKTITGHYAKEHTADKAADNGKNHTFLEQNDITDGIARKRTLSKDPISEPRRRRMYGQHQAVEGKIGTLKQRYGCKNIPYKTKNHKLRLIMATMVMNGLAYR